MRSYVARPTPAPRAWARSADGLPVGRHTHEKPGPKIDYNILMNLPTANGGGLGMSEGNKAVVRRLVEEVWNKGNLDLADDIVDPSYIRHDPSWPEEIHGPEGFRQFTKAMRESFFEGQFKVEDMLAEGDQVAVRWSFSGTHIAELMGIPPPGGKSPSLGSAFCASGTASWSRTGSATTA